MNPRIVKPKKSPRVIATAVAVGLLLFAFIIFAVWYSAQGIKDARKRGLIVEKEFLPLPEQQITLGSEGALTAREKDGKYILTVEVPQDDGTKKPYYVYVSKKLYDDLQVGDQFDVGAYLVPSATKKK